MYNLSKNKFLYTETSQLYVFHNIANLLSYLGTWESPLDENIYPSWLWDHIKETGEDTSLNMIRFLVVTRKPTLIRRFFNLFLPKSRRAKENTIGILRNSKDIKYRMEYHDEYSTRCTPVQKKEVLV